MPRVKPQRPILDKSHPLARGLVLDLPFTERGGDVLDISGHENNGARTATGSQYQIGRYGPCLEVDGTTDIPVGDLINDGLPIASKDYWTISMIFEPKQVISAGSMDVLYERNNSAGRSILLLGWDASGHLQFSVSDDVGVGYSTSFTQLLLEVGVPVAVTVTSEQRIGAIYFNGGLVQDFDYTSSGAITPDVHNILKNAWIAPKAILHSHRAWDRALTAQEVASLYVDPWQIYRKSRDGYSG